MHLQAIRGSVNESNDDIFNNILWWEALRDAIEDKEYTEALDIVNGAIKMLRREASTPAVGRDD